MNLCVHRLCTQGICSLGSCKQAAIWLFNGECFFTRKPSVSVLFSISPTQENTNYLFCLRIPNTGLMLLACTGVRLCTGTHSSSFGYFSHFLFSLSSLPPCTQVLSHMVTGRSKLHQWKDLLSVPCAQSAEWMFWADFAWLSLVSPAELKSTFLLENKVVSYCSVIRLGQD